MESWKFSLLVFIISFFSILIYQVVSGEVQLNNEKSSSNKMMISIENIPDEWTKSKRFKYYYEIDTHVIYVGNNAGSLLIKLESEDYDKYIYDEQKKEFIGIE